MKKSLLYSLIPLLLTITGCASQMTPGQAFITETRVLGVDLSIPIPFAEGVNLANIRLGWVENKIYSGNGVTLRSDSTHQDINLLTGSGSVIRYFDVSYIPKPDLTSK